MNNEILIKSTLDDTLQPSLFFRAKGENRPLLVGLHTWSADRFNQVENMLPYCEKYDFNLLLPEFRGPNLTKNPDCEKACASVFAKQDIKDAIDYIIENESIDTENIFLLGASGGGFMTLMMCGMIPEYFKAAAAFVPICNLLKWSEENDYYKEHIYACCKNSKEEMLNRSPVSYKENISKANLKIFHGKWDPVVPFTQSYDFYKELLDEYPKSDIYLDIFKGYHEMKLEDAFLWINGEYHKEKLAEVTG